MLAQLVQRQGDGGGQFAPVLDDAAQLQRAAFRRGAGAQAGGGVEGEVHAFAHAQPVQLASGQAGDEVEFFAIELGSRLRRAVRQRGQAMESGVSRRKAGLERPQLQQIVQARGLHAV